MKTLLAPNELCSKILRIRPNFSNIENNIPNFIDENNVKISDIQYQHFTKNELSIISNELKTQESFTKILINHNFEFPFTFDFNQNPEKLINNSQYHISKQFIIYQLYYFLSFCVSNQKQKLSHQNYEKLINSILSSLSSNIIIQNSKLNLLYTSCFVFLYEEYLTLNDCDIKYAYDTFAYYFINNKTIYSQSLSLFTAIAQKIVSLISKHENAQMASDLLNELIIFSDIFIQKYPKVFNKEIAYSFINVISKIAYTLDSLVLFDHMLPIIGPDSINSCLVIFPNSIVCEIEQGEPIYNIEELVHQESIKLSEENVFSTSFTLVDWKTFEEPINTHLNQIEFPKLIDFENMIKPEILTKISYIMNIVSEEPKIIINLYNELLNSINSSKSKYSLDEAAAFLYLIMNIYSFDKNYFPIKLLLNSTVFNPSITVFNNSQTQAWCAISTLRTIVLNMFIQNGISFLNTIFYELMCYPMLFAEFIYRLSNTNIEIGKNEVPVISQLLMYAMTFYQHFKTLTSNELNATNTARISIFYFFSKVFEKNDLLILFFQDPFFIETFLSLSFEYYPRNFVFTYLLKYLSFPESLNNKECIKKINQMIEIACDSLYNTQISDLLLELLRVVNTAIEKCRLMSFYFEPITTPLCKGIIKLQNNNKTQQFLMELLNFLALTAEFHKISPVEVSALESIILNTFDEEPSQELFVKIVNLIAGQKLNSLYPSFIIQQPLSLKLLLSVFQKSKMLQDLFTFVARLCQFSSKNCIEAHHGEVDLFLINLLYSWRNNPSIPINLVASALSLVILISSAISSVSIVHQFVSLLSPINGRFLSYYHLLSIKALDNILKNSKNKPFSCLPLSEPCTFEIDGLKGEQMENGLSIIIWIFDIPNETNYKAQLCSLSDTKGQRITLLLQNNSISALIEAIVNTKKVQWSFNSDFTLIENSWNLITFTIEPDINIAHGFFTLNDIYFYETKFDNNFHFNNGPIAGQIGGFSCNVNDRPSYLYSFGISNPINHSKISELYHLGRNITKVNLLNPICYFVGDEKSDQISMKNIANIKSLYHHDGIRTKKSSIPLIIPNSFSSILVKKSSITILLPVFAQWNLPIENGQIIQNLPDVSLDLLEHSLSLSVDSQEQFAVSNGFKIIFHLIISSDGHFITYNLYQRFYNLMRILNNEKCIKQLIICILMNIDLWIKSKDSPENHISILKHWSNVLVPFLIKKQSDIFKRRSPSWVLTVLRRYYWYTFAEEDEISINKARPAFSYSDISNCRAYLMNIIELISFAFTSDDLKCLLSHAISCTDLKQTEELLELTKKLISIKEVISNMNESFSFIPLVQYLLNSQSEDIICKVFQIIILAHKNNLIKDFSLISHVDIILHQLTPSFVTKTLFSKLLLITKEESPELFLICSWMAMNLGNAGVRNLLKTLKPSPSYITSEFWAIWLVVSLFKAEYKMQISIAKYLIKCTSSKEYSTIFATCDVIGRALNQNELSILHIKEIIIFEFGKILLSDNYKADFNDIVKYFELVRHYLFFHNTTQNNQFIEKLFSKSLFYNETCSNNENGNMIEIKNSNKSIKKETRPINRFKARYSLHRNHLIENAGYEEIDESIISILSNRETCVESKFKHNKSNIYKSKRISILTINEPLLNNENRHKPSNKIISMTSMELDNRIREIASQEIYYRFGLRFDENMKWLDINIAKQAVSVFIKNSDTRVAENVILICSFLIHYSQSEIHQALPLLNRYCSNLIGVFNFFNHHCSLCNINQINSSSGDQVKNYINKVERRSDKIISASPLSLLKHFLKFESDNADIALDIFEMLNESIVGLSSSLIADHADKIGYLIDESSKLWTQLWHHMTLDRAPWYKSISNTHEIHFKRDFTICSNMCPVKMCRNFNFDNHMKASLVRDTGNEKNAEEYIKNYQNLLAKQYKEKNPNALFDVIEDKEASQNIRRESMCNSKITMKQQCIIELPCEFIKVQKVTSGTFVLLTKVIMLTKSEKKTIIIHLHDITNIYLRTRFHHPTAIEIFTRLGKSYFINFPNIKALPLLKNLKSVNLPKNISIQSSDFRTYFMNSKFTDDWINHRISNFEYLMKLNIMSGRSFNDCSQYPVFPWVLCDYDSNNLDLNNKNVYRDLSKPVGALNQERLDQLYEKWRLFENLNMDQYLFSSGYVCPLTVYLWLVREEPFTTLHIDIQSGKFDHAARLFSSIPVSFYNSTHLQNDFRELIPEFYTTPEFLMNENKYDLGKIDNNKVDDVQLPKWASNQHEFIYIMRKALESEYVSEHLNQWIDLIWGDKQRGEKAQEASNVYMKEMYDDIWTQENLRDPAKRAEIEAILCHVGQIPPQLFDRPHPKRLRKEKSSFLINKSYTFNMPTSRLIASSVTEYKSSFTSSIKSKAINISAVDLSGQLIQINFPLHIFLATKQNYEKTNLKFRKKSSEVNFQISNETNKVPLDFITTLQVSKDCQTARKDLFCQLSTNVFCLVSANKYDLIIANTGSGHSNILIHHRCEIIKLAADGFVDSKSNGWIAFADKDANINIYQDNNFKYCIPTFSKSITCLAMSFGFKQIVAGTCDGDLLFISMTNRSIERVVELKGYQPESVTITQSFGFVIVYMTTIKDGRMTYHLALYSVNGEFIHQKEIKYPLEKIYTYQDKDGFDYIIASDENLNMYSFEAFYLNLSSPFYLSKSSPSSILVLSKERLFVEVTSEGSIVFVPF